jgi:hypothetical protein
LKALEASAGPETKVVEIKLGDNIETVTIKRISFAESQTISSKATIEDADGNNKIDSALLASTLVSLSVINDDGSQTMTADEVKKLSPKVGIQLLNAVNEFNSFSEKSVENAAKNSSPTAATATS